MVLLLVLPLTGCFFGRSKIVVSDGGNYDVYANDEYICSTRNDDCSLPQRGGTAPVHLQAVKDGVVAGETDASRSITAASILWAPFTYYTSLFIYKAYPDEIYIYVDDREQFRDRFENRYGGSDTMQKQEDASSRSDGGSVWEKPLL